MIVIGDTPVSVMVGEMGIKTMAVGDIILCDRPGGYLHITLTTKEDS